ncbi:MAG: hypothetical protein R3F49_08870 [Planctomycetota bacterium]
MSQWNLSIVACSLGLLSAVPVAGVTPCRVVVTALRAQEKQPIPPAEEVQALVEQCRATFKLEIASGQLREVAQSLLEGAKSHARGAAERFAYISFARELAIRDLDLELFEEALARLAQDFQGDFGVQRAEGACQLIAGVEGPLRPNLARFALDRAEEMFWAEQYPLADRILGVLLKAAPVATEPPPRAKALQAKLTAYRSPGVSKALLAARIGEAKAAEYLAAARFDFAQRGDTARALSRLARAGDADGAALLALLANRDLKDPKSAREQFELGREWADWAGRGGDVALRQLAVERARHWLATAAPELSGADADDARELLGDLSDESTAGLDRRAPDGRWLAPDAARAKELRDRVELTYKSRLAAAKTPGDKAALGWDILRDARQVEGGEAFMLLEVAQRDLALGSRDIGLCAAILAERVERFAVDELHARGMAWADFVPTKNTADLDKYMSEVFSALDACLDSRRYDLAELLYEGANRAIRGARASELRQGLRQELMSYGQDLAPYRELSKFEARLAASPGDPDAKYELGRILLILGTELDRGLSLLAEGTPERERKLAREDLGAPSTGDGRYDLAVEWMTWSNSVATTDPQFAAFGRDRAQTWYERALEKKADLLSSVALRAEKEVLRLALDRESRRLGRRTREPLSGDSKSPR